MSNIAALSFPDGALELVQFDTIPNSATWQVGAAWTGGPVQFTTDADGVTYTSVAACNVATANGGNGDPCVFLSYPTTVQYLSFAKPGTDSDGAPASPFAWYPIIPAGQGYALDLSAAQLPDATVQVFGVITLDGSSSALQSCWQSKPGPPGFTPYEFNTMTDFDPSLPGPLWNNTGVRPLTLPDGRVQLWALTRNGAQQEIVTCNKTTTHAGAAWSAWSSVASLGGAPNLALIAGALGPAANEIIILGYFDPFTGTFVPFHMQRIYLFAIADGGGGLWMASFTPNATTPSPSGVVWTPVTLPSGLPSGATITDLTVIAPTTGGVHVFIEVDPGPAAPDNSVIIYTQSLQVVQRFEFIRYWSWSDWVGLPTDVAP